MHTVYVTSKGQLVVPADIRRRYGIKPGTRVNFVEENGRIIFQPVTREYIHSFRGVFKLGPGEKPSSLEIEEASDLERQRQSF